VEGKTMSELVNPQAPVVSRREIDIAAPPGVVWDVLTGFSQWPAWNPDVKSMAMSDPVAVGSTFRWKAGPGTIRSTIRQVEPPRRVVWTGKTMGIRAVDAFAFEPHDGGTLVRQEESWAGVIARLLRASLQRTLDRSLESGLQHLKAESERRAGAVG
jgi:hypothetical protein